MTKEEALTIVNMIDRNILTDKECYVVDNIFELVESSIPSNVDEVAEEWAKSVYGNPGKSAVSISGVCGFKAGVEWLAQQGQTLDSLIWRDEDDKLFIEAFVDENKFKMADNVIIQVRKKQ